MKIEELKEENEKLKAEIFEAMEILSPGRLVNGLGEEIPTTLKQRATYTAMALQSEADFVDDVSKERNQYVDKYDKLLLNFKDLDRYNDVLYRLFVAAKRLRNSGYDGPFIGEATSELYGAIAEVERHERELVKTRKEKNSAD